MNDRVANRGDRQNDLQNRLDNRNENWEDWRNDRWDNRDNVREDWQDWADHHWDDHDHWHHGYWHDNYGGWWDHMWNEHPGMMALGLTGWGVNRMNYWFGYWGYYNPYYVEPYYVAPEVVIDYSQPLTVYEQAAYTEPAPAETPATPGAPAAESTDPATQAFDLARQAFYAGNYDEALAGVNTALATRSDDAVLHEFRALVMFASGKYTDAAAGLHAVLAVGPGWDWTTLSSLYANIDTYTQQLRALEDYARQNDPAPAARFVLAYHYLTCGHKDEAVKQLQAVLAAEPKDEVAAQMLQMNAPPADDAAETPTTPPAAADEPSVTIPAADLVGTWKAKGQGGAEFSLELKDGGQFVWTYSAAGKETKAEGVYALDGNNLALEPDAGGTMLAEVTPPANGKFHFQEVGGPDGDPGLDFQK